MSSAWVQPPPPATKLGYHRQLAPNAGVHVSPICLGAMSIGDAWSKSMGFGDMDKESSFVTPEQIKFLDEIVPFDKGFPYNMFGDGSDYTVFYKSAGHFDKWPVAQAIRPQKQ